MGNFGVAMLVSVEGHHPLPPTSGLQHKRERQPGGLEVDGMITLLFLKHTHLTPGWAVATALFFLGDPPEDFQLADSGKISGACSGGLLAELDPGFGPLFDGHVDANATSINYCNPIHYDSKAEKNGVGNPPSVPSSTTNLGLNHTVISHDKWLHI